MICKCLEKKITIIPEDKDTEPAGTVNLEYYLLESDGEKEDGINSEKVYGLEIQKIQNGSLESKVIKNYSNSKEEAMKVIKRLAENTVTPLCLQYILDDILGE